MDLEGDSPVSSRLTYVVISSDIITNRDKSMNRVEVAVRCNGKLFYIHISLSDFYRSPQATAQYIAYLGVLRSDEEQIDGLFESDFEEWVTVPFEPLFRELAPAPSLDHIIKFTLEDYLFPEFFMCALNVIDEKLVPRRMETQDSGHMPPGAWLSIEFRGSLLAWATAFHPSHVNLSFEQPEDALVEPPQKVLVDGGKTACFFKAFYPGAPGMAETELETYKKITQANLGPHVRICRLHGVVQDEEGLLMASFGTNAWSITAALASQVGETVAQLHEAGIVWRDAKAENVLIDSENNAWITDFGGGYTRGWADTEKAGTVERDLQGLARIIEFLDSHRDSV